MKSAGSLTLHCPIGSPLTERLWPTLEECSGLTRLRGFACFSAPGSLQIKWLGQKVFTTECELTDSDRGISLPNLTTGNDSQIFC
jgi:hypothetical protein